MTSDRDPTRMRNQNALTRSPGTIWLVTGGALAVIAVAVLGALTQRQPVIAGVAIGLVVVLYVTMVVVRFAVAKGRQVTLAVLMILIAATGLGAVLGVLAAEAGQVAG